MKHLARIQVEFLKQARNWDDLSYEEQKGYLSRHPKTKRKITARPLQNEHSEITESKKEVSENSETKELYSQNIGKINKKNETKIIDLFKPLFTKHETYLRTHISKQYDDQRKKFLTQFPNKTNDDLNKAVLLLDYPDNQQVKDFVKDKDKIDRYRDRRFLNEFPIKDRQGHLELNSQFGSLIYDENKFKERVNKIIDYSIEVNEAKLVRAIYSKLEGLDIKSVNEIHSNIGRQGIEGTYKIELHDGTTGKMNTHSIFAGGYNIQVLHYRYLISIDDSLKNKKVIENEPLTSQELEIKNIIKRMLPNDFDIVTPLPNEIRQSIEQLPGASKNFFSFIKKGLMYKREYGNYYVKRFNYYLTQQGLDFLKEDTKEDDILQEPNEKLTKHFEKQNEKFAKNVAAIFQDIKTRIKNWNTWAKKNLEHYIQQGQRSPDELINTQLEIDRLQKFLNKHPYKRTEIYQKVFNKEFKFSDFDEISDLFSNSNSDNYVRLKKAIQRNEYKI